MRAHGIGDESGHIDDDNPASDWDHKLGGGNVPSCNRRMYALRTNPNRLESCGACENCGKEFLSWKLFLAHGKCATDYAESLVSSPGSDGEDDVARRGVGFSKRKRSLRLKVSNSNSNCTSSEEEDLAICLMMLSNATTTNALLAEAEESCASASREDQERRKTLNFVAPISYRAPPIDKSKGVARGLFECKACKKVFNSHQALGGHRASHKKVKGCFAARIDHHNLDPDSAPVDEDAITHEEFLLTSKSTSNLQYEHDPKISLMASKRKSKVHECSICHRIFSSGQALGGHKRCHWITSNAPDTSSSLPRFHDHNMEHVVHQNPKFAKSEPLDLNLPAAAHGNEFCKVRRDPQNPLSFEVSTEFFLQSSTDIESKENDENDHHDQNNDGNDNKNNINDEDNNSNGSMQNVADSKVKLAKLSDLKDMNMSGGSSPWLQVGIGSTTDLGADS